MVTVDDKTEYKPGVADSDTHGCYSTRGEDEVKNKNQSCSTAQMYCVVKTQHFIYVAILLAHVILPVHNTPAEQMQSIAALKQYILGLPIYNTMNKTEILYEVQLEP